MHEQPDGSVGAQCGAVASRGGVYGGISKRLGGWFVSGARDVGLGGGATAVSRVRRFRRRVGGDVGVYRDDVPEAVEKG